MRFLTGRGLCGSDQSAQSAAATILERMKASPSGFVTLGQIVAGLPPWVCHATAAIVVGASTPRGWQWSMAPIYPYPSYAMSPRPTVSA